LGGGGRVLGKYKDLEVACLHTWGYKNKIFVPKAKDKIISRWDPLKLEQKYKKKGGGTI